MSFELRQRQRQSRFNDPESGTLATAQTTETSPNTELSVTPLPTGVTYPYGPFQGSDFVQGSVGSGGDIPSTTVISTNTQESDPGRAITTTGTNPGLVSNAPVAVSSSSKGSNLSSGAIAGVAIGALIVGAVLAFFAAFFLFKRRINKSHNDPVSYKDYSDSSPELVMLQKSAGRNSPYVQVSQTPMQAPIPAPAPTKSPDVVASILPAPAHETEVQGRVTALFGQIHRHIESFYRDVHASITPSMEPELAKFGAKDVNMAEMLQDCSSPTTALKHALVAYVLGITSPKQADSDGETLFPSVLDSVRPLDVGSGTDHHNITTALTIHRRLSVFLYTSSSSRLSQNRSQATIRESAEHFSLTFFPWANPGSDDQDKEDDLTHVIVEALEMRIWLFGQPGKYEFRWDGVGMRGVVVAPEVMRTDSEEGGRARVVVEGSVVGL